MVEEFYCHTEWKSLNETIGHIDNKWKLQPHLQKHNKNNGPQQDRLVNNHSSHGVCKEIQQRLSSDLWRIGMKLRDVRIKIYYVTPALASVCVGSLKSLDTGSRQSPSQPAIPLKSLHFSLRGCWVACTCSCKLEAHWSGADLLPAVRLTWGLTRGRCETRKSQVRLS